MNVQEIVQHISPHLPQATVIKASGLLGGGTAFAGLTADLSGWSEIAQILANFGIFIGAITAFSTFVYTIYKSRKKK